MFSIIKYKIQNVIGVMIIKYILRHFEEGWIVERENGTNQIIKVFSLQAYQNIVRPVLHKKEKIDYEKNK